MPTGPHMVREEQALGLKAIYAACRALYPDQPTPLQVTALRKFWMGGPDPLDFINMYSNTGSVETGSPAHWHYVTNGLSDLYGDSRLHSQCTSPDDPSGFGFELTLRVRRDPSEQNPPTWPAHLLQSLARYVFHSQAQLMVGDHIPWPSALDKPPTTSLPTSGRIDCPDPDAQSIAMAAAATAAASLLASKSGSLSPTANALTNPSTYASMVAAALAAVNTAKADREFSRNSTAKVSKIDGGSRIRHMLLVEDPQLKKITTPYGYVQFLQIVGLCDEELRLVQRWTGTHVAELMRRLPDTGGALLVTDMRRKHSLFELEPQLFSYVNEHLRREGSNLSGVTTQYFAWAPISSSLLGELLPGEAEVRRIHRSGKEPTNSDSTEQASGVSDLRTVRNKQHNSLRDTDDSCVPTDLSMPRSSEADVEVSHSTDPIAMDTDETVVSSSTCARKQIDEEEFVDVVGDSGPPSVLDSKNHLDSSRLAIDSKQIVSEPEQVLPVSNDRVDLVKTTASTANSVTGKTMDTQSISAPGGFSPWCGRLSNSTTRTNASQSGISTSSMVHRPTDSVDVDNASRSIVGGSELVNPVLGPLGFRPFNIDSPGFMPGFGPLFRPNEVMSSHTPGSAGEGSAPCTPLAHLSLSPASLDLYPTRVIKCLDVHLCREAGEMLPLAVSDRLKHGRHFTFLNAHFPDHAITLVPNGVSGAFVTEDTPYVARGPWLQVLLPEEFLERLEFQFSSLMYPNELQLPLVFRWPERHLRICVVDPAPKPHPAPNFHSPVGNWNQNPLLPKAMALSIPPDQVPARESLVPSTDSLVLPMGSVKPFARNATGPHADHLSSPVDSTMALSSTTVPLFPAGFTPPPPSVLSALFSGQHMDQRTLFNSTHGGPPGSLPNPSQDALIAGWMKMFAGFMNQRDQPMTQPSSVHNPFISGVFQSALAAMQHGPPVTVYSAGDSHVPMVTSYPRVSADQ